MSSSLRQIDPPCKLTDYLSLPQVETSIPAHVIQDVLTQCEAWEQREKKLNMQAMIYLIIALALYPQCSTREVSRRLLEGQPEGLGQQDQVLTAGALCQRRQQLGVTPLRSLFTRLARPLALPHIRSALRFGRRLVAVDGTLENLPDTDANRTVFPYHCLQEHSRSPFPQARGVVLMECGTHVIFDAELITVNQGEISSNMLLLCDAGICCGPVLLTARTQAADVLGRLESQSWKTPWARLHDGSYLVKIAGQSAKPRGHVLTARVIEYREKLAQTGDLSEPIRLLTTLLDPQQYPIEALVRLYHER